ncbi:MAG: DUF1206 domain-containing protein [Acidobacteriota bacterium]|nr:DUF1206 domain-containing protein [Acidobacteriota bacterium]
MRGFRNALTRVGFCALGAVYAGVGYLAIRVAVAGARDRVTGFGGSFRYFLERPSGSLLVGGIAAGLAAFTLGRLLEVADPKRSFLSKIRSFVDALAHAAMAWGAIALLLRLRRGPSTRSLLAWLLARPWGVTLLEIAGAVVILIGAIQMIQAISGRLSNLPRKTSLGAAAPVVLKAGRFGYFARGSVSAIIGWFLIRTAVDLDPRNYHDIGAALGVIEHVRFGGLLLGFAGVGLIAYGGYLLVLGLVRIRA